MQLDEFLIHATIPFNLHQRLSVVNARKAHSKRRYGRNPANPDQDEAVTIRYEMCLSHISPSRPYTGRLGHPPSVWPSSGIARGQAGQDTVGVSVFPTGASGMPLD